METNHQIALSYTTGATKADVKLSLTASGKAAIAIGIGILVLCVGVAWYLIFSTRR